MSTETTKVGPSNFVWYEFVTPDAKVAEAFYCGVVGWTAETQAGGIPGQPYTLLKVGETPVAGLLTMPAKSFSDGSVKPGWMGYIGVDDVDRYTGLVQEAGGKVYRAPQDIPGIGRFSVVADPQGTVFVLFQPNTGQKREEAPAGTPGYAGWHELHAVEGKAAFDFYSELFGWTKVEAIDMGPMGVYQTFAAGGAPVGGVMTAIDQEHRPGWLYYFNVDAIDAAAARVKEHGGQILMGPHQVPGGSWIVQGIDLQGAMFAVLGPK